MAANAAVVMQKLANQTQITLQKMVNSANQLQSKYNADEAQKGRDWQMQMSKTAHQMEVEDLKKAGLNPVLSSGGSGAQSYTTSSASMTPESGASALSNVASSQLGAIGSMESARMTAAATRAAAAQSAAATRAAAATAAAATKYNADIGYKKAALKVANDLAIAKLGNETKIKVAGINKGNTWASLIDKYANRTGLAPVAVKMVRGTVTKPANHFYETFVKKPQQMFENRQGNVTKNNFSLSQKGISVANDFLKQIGVRQTASNRKLAVQAFVYKDQNAFDKIVRNVPYNRHHR